MKIVEQTLNKIKSIGKNQCNFFINLVQGFIGVVGKRTPRNLSRFLGFEEHTISRQMNKDMDFISVNTELIKSIKKDDSIFIAAQDATFIPKSGKKTEELGFFWNGTDSKIEKGLEFDVIALVCVTGMRKEAYAISAEQSKGDLRPKSERKKKKKTELTKIDSAVDHIKKAVSVFVEFAVRYIVVDAFYAKKKYVDGIIELGFHIMSKLRKDARLFKPFDGEQKKRGRRRKIGSEKIVDQDFAGTTSVAVGNQIIEISSTIAYSMSLQRLIKVVRLRKIISPKKYAEAKLFSTDIEIDQFNIYTYYVARFQIEFVFRDAKGFTGMTDFQTRKSRRINYHVNTSLLALNVVKIQDHQEQEIEQKKRPFSIASWGRKYLIETVINRFILMFDLDPTLIKLHPNYQQFLEFAKISH